MSNLSHLPHNAPSNEQNSAPVPLRNGISVQELKQMTALRMAQSQDMWQKQTGVPVVLAPPVQKPLEGIPIREPTPPAASNGAAPHMPHGLTVQELKELTRMRLAREKLTQEETSKMQIARDALTAYRQSLYPDAEDSARPMTDHQLYTMVQEMEAQLQNGNAPVIAPPVVPDPVAAPTVKPAGVAKERPAPSNLFSLRRFALENRISEIEDKSAADLDGIPGPPPPSPKSLRNRPKLSVMCPPPVRKRSASDSNDLPYEVAESVLLTPTTMSPRKTYNSPRIHTTKTFPLQVDDERLTKTYEQPYLPETSEPDDGWYTARVPEVSPRSFWPGVEKPASSSTGYEDGHNVPRFPQIDARAYVRAGKNGYGQSYPAGGTFGALRPISEGPSATASPVEENIVYYSVGQFPVENGHDLGHQAPSNGNWRGNVPMMPHGYPQIHHGAASDAPLYQYGYAPHLSMTNGPSSSGFNVNIHGSMGFAPSHLELH